MVDGLFRSVVLTVLAVCGVALMGCQGADRMTQIQAEPFGEVGHQPVELYTLTNANGMVAKVTNYGATLTELHVPDRDGYLGDVVLGFDDLGRYQEDSPYFGATVGRVANRIADGEFVLDNKRYKLAQNDGENHLHGGERGYDKVVWNAEPVSRPEGPAIRFTYRSHDGEEGYPGTVDNEVVYILSNDNELIVEMKATTDQATPVNLAHHTYWNLAGHTASNILDHEVMINAAQYTPVDETMIPTGEIRAVVGTPFDFTEMKKIGEDIHRLPAEGDNPGGYDHNFVLRDGDRMKLAARVYEPDSGRVMEIHTDQPGMQFYTGNFLDGSITGKEGAVYGKHAAFCMETQIFPDAVHHEHFPSVILEPGETYRHRMVHRFLTY